MTQIKLSTLDNSGKIPSTQIPAPVDATSGTKGVVQLTGDLAGTAAAPTVPGLTSKESLANKGVAGGYVGLNGSGLIAPSQVQARNGLNAKLDFGAVGDGIVDDTAALQAALTAIGSSNGKLYIPAGTYKITAAITCPSIACEIYGDGPLTVIHQATAGQSGLFFGHIGGSLGVVAGGTVRDLLIKAGTVAPASLSGTIGLGIIAGSQVSVRRVTVYSGFDIAFDFNNNCYGAEMLNCRSTFGLNNVGLNLRTGSLSGSDMYFANNWIHGNVAAVHVSGGGGGYHFTGGQFNGGNSLASPNDAYGIVTIGKDYLSGAISGGIDPIHFTGVSWEGWEDAWAIRSYSSWSGEFICCNFNETGGAPAGALGIWKADNINDSKVGFRTCCMGGAFNNGTGKIMVLAGQATTKFQLVEENWRPTNFALTVDGGASIDVCKTTLAEQSGWTIGAYSLTPDSGIVYQGQAVVLNNDSRLTQVTAAQTSPGVVGPVFAGGELMVTTSPAVPGTNVLSLVRVVIPKSGTLHDLNAWISIASGNGIAVIYDTSATRNLIWQSPAPVVPTTSWKSFGDPALAVNAGDQYEFGIVFDNATASLGRLASTTGGATQLPTNFAPSGGANPKMAATTTLGGFSIPSTIAEGSITATSSVWALIARVV